MSDERLGKPSASSVSRYMNCAGAYLLSKDCEEFKTKEMAEWAASGERIHAHLAGEWPVAELSHKEYEVSQQCMALAISTLAKHDLVYHDCKITTEKRIWLKHGRKQLLSGKPDLVALQGTPTSSISLVGAVLDYKSSYGDQDPADENWQIATNIVLAAQEHPDVAIWYGAIIQPLVTLEPTVVKFTVADVDRIRAELIAMVERISQPGQPTTFGPWCKYCSAVIKCPSVRGMFLSLKLIDPNAEGEILGGYLKLAHSAEPVFKRLKERARGLLAEKPESVPGWKIGKGSSVRSINSPFGAFQILSDNHLLDREAFLRDCVSVSVGDIEKAVASHMNIKPKEAKSMVNQHLETVMEFKEKAGSLEEI